MFHLLIQVRKTCPYLTKKDSSCLWIIAASLFKQHQQQDGIPPVVLLVYILYINQTSSLLCGYKNEQLWLHAATNRNCMYLQSTGDY